MDSTQARLTFASTARQTVTDEVATEIDAAFGNANASEDEMLDRLEEASPATQGLGTALMEMETDILDMVEDRETFPDRSQLGQSGSAIEDENFRELLVDDNVDTSSEDEDEEGSFVEDSEVEDNGQEDDDVGDEGGEEEGVLAVYFEKLQADLRGGGYAQCYKQGK